MSEDKDPDGEAGGNDGGKQTSRSSGERVRIQLKPEFSERPSPPIPFAWNPTPEMGFDYDPYGVLPRPDDIPFDEPAWTIAWESPVSDPPTGVCHPGRCSCGASLPPGKWLELDRAGYVEDTTRFPMVDGNPEESPSA